MQFFITNILFHENWTGAKVRFFNLDKLSTHIPKYLGWDVEIPYYNTTKESSKKLDLMEKLKDVRIVIPGINEIFYHALKKSKYWIHI